MVIYAYDYVGWFGLAVMAVASATSSPVITGTVNLLRVYHPGIRPVPLVGAVWTAGEETASSA